LGNAQALFSDVLLLAYDRAGIKPGPVVELEEIRRRSERGILGDGIWFSLCESGTVFGGCAWPGIASAWRLGESWSCRGVICVEEMR